MPTAETFASLEENESLSWGVWLEVVWPKTYTEGVWQPMADYVDLYYTPGAQTSWQQLESTTNLDNLLDVSMCRQFVCAADNFSYNQYFLQNSADGLYYRIPWDMDYTFGDYYDEFYSLDMTSTFLPDMELDTLYYADSGRGAAAHRPALERTARHGAHHGERDRPVRGCAGPVDGQRGPGAGHGPVGQCGDLPLGVSLPHAGHRADFGIMEQRLAFLDDYMAEYTPADREAFDVLPK